MSTLAESLVSSTSRPVALRKRPDLTTRRHRYHGQSFWVVKEPIALQYFRFHEEEFAILNMLDGRRSMDQIKTEFEQQFTPQKVAFRDLQQFIGMLHRNGLVISEASGQGKQLNKRRSEKKFREWMGKLANVFALRFRGVDPDRFLAWLYQYTWWLFSWPAVIGALILGLSALSLVAINSQTFVARLPQFHSFFGPSNWIYLAITMAVVKVLHEFGHGLSCKHFGGECHELGAMLLVFTPALYCNVSDSWMLPNKWHRAAIGAAGMYIELILASIATFLWWFSEPGLVNHLCLSVMFICSVSTLMFNGNPLLRFDGYYILMDLAEIPNLRQKSTEVLKRFFNTVCLGLEQPESPFLPKRNRFFFALYTIASEIYRLVVVFSILFFLNKVFEPYGLKILGQLIGFAGVIGLFVQPIWQMIQFFYVPGRMGKVKATRVILTIATVLGLLAAICFVPLPHAIHCSFEVIPRDAANVYAGVDGQLISGLRVKPGDRVSEGQLIAELRNPELDSQMIEAKGSVDVAETRVETLKRSSIRERELNAQIPNATADLEAARGMFDEKRKLVDLLRIVAPRAGVVIAPPFKEPRPEAEGRLPTWNGAPFDKKNENAWLQRSDLICRIGDPDDLEAMMVIDQTDVDLIAEGDPVRMRLQSYAHDEVKSEIISIAKWNMGQAPAGLSTPAGGDLNTKTDKTTGAAKPLSTTYQARASLKHGSKLSLGMRGQARIDTEWQSIGTRLYRYAIRTFHFYL